ncbi:hypothetical protein DLAC_10853 [Tieghemostelium lacteum]|uniref:Uncharacterized protein n=1 Tax=Tieghemostelium lacteum TaxID=361077 RepID=A0A151Z3Y1_TIELA|nr:hypothetical protein DLAC_10853 [Tieghemostelium lacteum]|eukprot:KYQ88672.1 hypothetical protein DLAC_10853 [Tieghemostelium lacteum]
MKLILIITLLLVTFNGIVKSNDVLEISYFQSVDCDVKTLSSVEILNQCTLLGFIKFLNESHISTFSVHDNEPSLINSKCENYDEVVQSEIPLNVCQRDQDNKTSYIHKRIQVKSDDGILSLPPKGSCSQIISYGSWNCSSNAYVLSRFPNQCQFGELKKGSESEYYMTNCTKEKTFSFSCGKDSTCKNCVLYEAKDNYQCNLGPNDYINGIYNSFQYSNEPTSHVKKTGIAHFFEKSADQPNGSSKILISFVEMLISLSLITFLLF